MTVTIDDVRLPTEIEQGAKGGPRWLTSVADLANGKEARNQQWQEPKYNYDIGYGIQYAEDYALVLNFFMARRGRKRGFRFKDWTDFTGNNELIGTGNGAITTFQLIRNYTDTIAPYVRNIYFPVSGTVAVFNNGATATGWSVSTSGLVTFTTAPVAGHLITANFEFDVPVRFDNDQLSLAIDTFNTASIPSIPIIELK